METLFRAGVSNAVSATFLAMVVACLSRPLARRPAILHGLWLLVLLKLVTPPLYEVAVPWPVSSGPSERKDATDLVVPAFVDSPSGVEMSVEDVVVAWSPPTDLPDSAREETRAGTPGNEWSTSDWIWPLSVAWLGGTATIVVISLRRIRRFQSLLREARPASPDEQERVDALAGRLGLRRGPVLEWVQAKLSPMIWSLGRYSRLIVPKDVWKTLDEPQRSTLIVHELAHLRRGDHRVRYFELFVTALFWWHPLVWWVRQALRDAEEQCCDAWVVWAFPDAARSYAETLLETIDFLDKSKGPEPLLASGMGKVHHLRRRLTMILSESTPRRLGAWGILGLFGLAAMMLPVNATWAQKAEKPENLEVMVKSGDNLDDSIRVYHDVVTAVDEAPTGRFTVNVRTDPVDVVVSGSAGEVLHRLKLMLKELQSKPSRSEAEEGTLKALDQALHDLHNVVPDIKAVNVRLSEPVELSLRGRIALDRSPGVNVRLSEPVELSLKRNVVVVRGDEESPKRPLIKEEKAEIEKLQAQVKKLNGELQAKQKELMEAQAKLSKLGVDKAWNRRVKQLMDQAISAYADGRYVECEALAKKVMEIDPNETAAPILAFKAKTERRFRQDQADQKKPVIVERKVTRTVKPKTPVIGKIEKVDPTKRRVEMTIGSHDGLIQGHELKLFTDHVAKPTPLPATTAVTGHERKVFRVNVTKGKAPSDQQRIEELESRLKKLLDEVDSLKKERSKESTNK